MDFRPQGIIPAMVTPVDDSDRINLPAARALARRLADAGVHGVFVNGSQGEWYAFNDEEKVALLEAVVDEVGERVSVYAGAAAFTTREAIQQAQAAERCGAHAVSVLTPFFIRPSDEELYAHFAAVAQSTSLPILPYNNPTRTGVHIRPELVRRLAEVANVVGIKDSSGDLLTTGDFIRVAPKRFAVLVGHDGLIFPGLLYGASGAISSTANVAPELVVAIYNRTIAGDLEDARDLQSRLTPLRQAFTLGTFPAVVKEALSILGYPVGRTRAPVGPLTPLAREGLQAVLESMGLTIGKTAGEGATASVASAMRK